MGITTRGGIAKTLEYEKNDGLISEIESHTRITFILLIFAFMFSLLLQLLILFLFQIIYNATKSYQIVDKPIPKLNYYLQSISTNGDVSILPIIQTLNNSLATGSYINTYTFPRNDIQFCYHYQEDMVYFHGRLIEKYTTITTYNALNMKHHQEKYFITNDLGHDYKLPKNVSLVDIGDYILLYGML